jgi:hypothetical protein
VLLVLLELQLLSLPSHISRRRGTAQFRVSPIGA